MGPREWERKKGEKGREPERKWSSSQEGEWTPPIETWLRPCFAVRP